MLQPRHDDAGLRELGVDASRLPGRRVGVEVVTGDVPTTRGTRSSAITPVTVTRTCDSSGRLTVVVRVGSGCTHDVRPIADRLHPSIDLGW